MMKGGLYPDIDVIPSLLVKSQISILAISRSNVWAEDILELCVDATKAMRMAIPTEGEMNQN